MRAMVMTMAKVAVAIMKNERRNNMLVIAAYLISLKIAGVGNFSWLVPIALIIIEFVVDIALHYHKVNKIGSDWHKGMFD